MNEQSSSKKIWEERWHSLREEWLVVAAHRQNRPWSGETVENEEAKKPEYVADCYLCPRNERVGGVFNADYKGIYVFDNDLPCVGTNAPVDLEKPSGIYRNRPANGTTRVICYSPQHNLSLAEMTAKEIETVVAVWQQQYAELGARDEVNHVLIFENKGEAVGGSNLHPHGQIYATNFVFKIIETEAKAAQKHFAETEKFCLKTSFAPKSRVPSVAAMTDAQAADFAEALRRVLAKYDNLWRMPFPYVMPLHNAPTDGNYDAFHFHVEFHPPLRKSNLLKYLAGPEIGGGNFLSDTAPEEKAAELQMQSETHYKQEISL